jgi:hypothetical protein
MGKGYEHIYATLLPKLAGRADFAENAIRLGAEASGEGVLIHFLGRDYMITRNGAEPLDGQPVDVNNRSVLIYYILSSGSGEPSHDFAQLNRLTGLIDGQNCLTKDFMSVPLVRKFGRDSEGLGKVVASLGGTKLPAEASGKHVWQLRPLPKILAQIVLYEEDDEFPADIQIMFDQTAPRFLDFECLAFMSGCMIHALLGDR